MKSIHAPSGASFLEELKAAQATIDGRSQNDWAEVRAVLRRIPQLIEVVEWLEAKEKEWQEVFEKYLFEAPETAMRCEAKAIFAKELLSKLEEGASKDASEK